MMKLKEITAISSGYPFRGRIAETNTSTARAVQMKDISLETGINWQTSVKTKLTGKIRPTWLKTNDILFVARGNHNYAVLVDNGAESMPAVAAPHFYILRCTTKQVLPDYLAWLLNQEPCQRYYQREAEGTFTKSIRRSILENTTIIIPPLVKQQSIIQLVESLKQQQQIIKELASNNHLLMNSIAADLFKGNHQ